MVLAAFTMQFADEGLAGVGWLGLLDLRVYPRSLPQADGCVLLTVVGRFGLLGLAGCIYPWLCFVWLGLAVCVKAHTCLCIPDCRQILKKTFPNYSGQSNSFLPYIAVTALIAHLGATKLFRRLVWSGQHKFVAKEFNKNVAHQLTDEEQWQWIVSYIVHLLHGDGIFSGHALWDWQGCPLGRIVPTTLPW